MDLSMLYDVLDVPEEDGLGRLLFAARKEHYALQYLMLSAVRQEGIAMSDAARHELERAERRALRYGQILDRVAARVPVSPVKGKLIARSYPKGLLRPQGDLDLVTSGEADLWRAVRVLMADKPLYVGVSVLGAPTRHLVVTLTWTPEDRLLDPEIRVEVCTAAFVGDDGAVPIRAELPEDVPTASLLALAEERFQRTFYARDAIDLYMIGQAPCPEVPEIAQAAHEYHLAPELRELALYAEQRVPLGRLAGLGSALEEYDRQERRRRAGHTAAAVGPGGTADALAQGRPLYGMPLRSAENRADRERSQIHLFGGSALLRTPVGDYLLVADEVVGQAEYDAAQRELDRLAEEAR
ncbi:hypothetical protein [Streptomyces tubercidicus]|uniref:hypothetical protein n=1 Tax=Streptomyces tubercidicus TaxID=47759 RepID=UPI003465FA85